MSFNFVHYSNNTLLLVSLFWLNQNESFCECLSTRCFINCKSFTTIFRIYLLLKWNEFLFSLSVSQKSFSLGGFRLKVSNFSIFPTISYILYDIDLIIYVSAAYQLFLDQEPVTNILFATFQLCHLHEMPNKQFHLLK